MNKFLSVAWTLVAPLCFIYMPAAQAIVVVNTPHDYLFTFTANCSDCGAGPGQTVTAGIAHGTIELHNYVLNSAFSGHLTGFTYSSTLLGTVKAPFIDYEYGAISGPNQSSPALMFGFHTNNRYYDFYEQLGHGWQFRVNGNTLDQGDNFVLTGQVAGNSVPEPTSLVLVGLGLAALGFSKRKKA